MSNEFIQKLIETNETKTQNVLKFVINQKIRIYVFMKIFNIIMINDLISTFRISHYCVYICSITIISNTIYYNTLTAKTSNHIMCRYFEHVDRFLQIQFTNEKFEIN